MKILMICHGNICRSPMAEYMLKDLLKKNNISNIEVESKATSYEEIGNGMHYGTRKILDKYNINYDRHIASHFDSKDYNKYDLILAMDDNNIRNLNLICKDKDNKYKKIRYLLDNKNVLDPWYTGNFEETYRDIKEALDELIKVLGK